MLCIDQNVNEVGLLVYDIAKRFKFCSGVYYYIHMIYFFLDQFKKQIMPNYFLPFPHLTYIRSADAPYSGSVGAL
jgi:hypothetical protein